MTLACHSRSGSSTQWCRRAARPKLGTNAMRHSRHLATGLGRPEVVSRVKWILGFGSSGMLTGCFVMGTVPSCRRKRAVTRGRGAPFRLFRPSRNMYGSQEFRPKRKGSDYSGALPQLIWSGGVTTISATVAADLGGYIRRATWRTNVNSKSAFTNSKLRRGMRALVADQTDAGCGTRP